MGVKAHTSKNKSKKCFFLKFMKVTNTYADAFYTFNLLWAKSHGTREVFPCSPQVATLQSFEPRRLQTPRHRTSPGNGGGPLTGSRGPPAGRSSPALLPALPRAANGRQGTERRPTARDGGDAAGAAAAKRPEGGGGRRPGSGWGRGARTHLLIRNPLRFLQAERASEGAVLRDHAQAAGRAHELLGVATRGHPRGHVSA